MERDTGIVPGSVIFITTAKLMYYITKILAKCIIFRAMVIMMPGCGWSP